ncbi:LysE family translocator [Paenibacillus methanolicus]|uniref:Threonine/homoserine/homoserine lactone efflux protein n=1 Tax=Paenibacillus methanolicus TaxID=582686 RepID=A0A5S5CFU6_9BACL|nr:LysE family translocator [Paenibacillus methanolicus]TYP78167.1 threonine/homoserine/homoserine lactone efflux protein [Paenibacillus methanolicus]
MFGIMNYEVFLVSCILLNLIPGADTMYVLGRSVTQGRKAGVYSVFGIISGALIHTLFVACGLSVILMKSMLVFNAIKIAGVVYLVYLGIRMFLDRSTPASIEAGGQPGNVRGVFMQGILTSLVNPKVSLFFLAFLPQFLAPGASGPVPFLLLGLTFCATGLLWCLVVAYGSSYMSGWLKGSPRAVAIMNKVTGVMFIGLGLNLLRTKAPQ